MRWVGHVARMGEEFVQSFDGKARRKEDGIRMDLRKIGLGSVDWIQLTQDRDRWRVLAPRT
jgi:hypothetical protein